jgi:hypothetical protein
VWDRRDKPDSWIESETQARNQIQDAIDNLIDAGIVGFDQVHESQNGKPIDATLSVNDI